MSRARRMFAAALTLATVLAACGGGGDGSDGDRPSVTGTTGEAASTDSASPENPLEGTWTTVITRELEMQAAAAADLGPTDHTRESLFGGPGPATIVLTFVDGQMIHTSAVQGGEPEVGWEGDYEIVDEDTFVAGDTGDLYIEYTYSIQGDRLFLDMVRDDYPTASEDELTDEIYAQTVIYESAPFTRGS